MPFENSDNGTLDFLHVRSWSCEWLFATTSAIRGISRKWDSRIAELQDKLFRSEDDWAELLAEVKRAKRRVAKGK